MVTQFETGSTGKGSNTLLYIGIAAVAGFLIYRYVIKPKMDKDKEKPKQ